MVAGEPRRAQLTAWMAYNREGVTGGHSACRCFTRTCPPITTDGLKRAITDGLRSPLKYMYVRCKLPSTIHIWLNV